MLFVYFILILIFYDIDVFGYKIEIKNCLCLFDLDLVDFLIIKDGINFDKIDIVCNLIFFFYLDDSDC